MAEIHKSPARSEGPEPIQGEGGLLTRRRALLLGTGIVAVSVAGGFFISRDGGKVRRDPQPGGQGGQGAIETPPVVEDEITINTRNPYYIERVIQENPQLHAKIQTFLGSTFEPISGQQGNDIYPWTQLTTPNSEHLTLSLQPTGPDSGLTEPPSTWQKAQSHPSFTSLRWEKLPDRSNTFVSFNDLYPRGLSIATLSGWTNVDSPDERYFSMQTQYVERLQGLDPETRRADFFSLAGSLFEARAFG